MIDSSMDLLRVLLILFPLIPSTALSKGDRIGFSKLFQLVYSRLLSLAPWIVKVLHLVTEFAT